MRKLLLFFSCSVAVVSCDNPGPEPGAIPFLKVEIIEPYAFGYDKWIFATNSETGELLDAQRIEDVKELATLKEFTNFDLSILIAQPNYYAITTYRNFSHNEIVLSNESLPVQIPSQVGFAKINITNLEAEGQYSPTVNFSSSFYGSAFPISPTYDGNTYSMFIRLAKASDKVLATGKNAGTLVYHIFDNVTDGSVHSADFNNFVPHQDQFIIDGTSGYVTVSGLADDDRSNFTLVSNSRWDLTTQPPLIMGTVPGFTRYRTVVNLSSVYYSKLGGPVTSFTRPEYSASIINHTMTDFESSINIPYEYKSAVWGRYSGNVYTLVNVYSDEETTISVNYKIPPNIRSLYPEFSIDDLDFTALTYTLSPGTWSYEDMIAQQFKNQVKSEYEYYDVHVY